MEGVRVLLRYNPLNDDSSGNGIEVTAAVVSEGVAVHLALQSSEFIFSSPDSVAVSTLVSSPSTLMNSETATLHMSLRFSDDFQ